jgi:hypothetical protein
MSDATINPSVRNKVLQVASDAIAERTKLTRFFRFNAQAKHGVPQDPDDVSPPQIVEVPRTEKIVVEHDHKNAPQPVEQQIMQPTTQTPSRGLRDLAIAAGSAAALAAAGGLGWWAAGTKSPSLPSNQEPAQTVEHKRYESPLQYLQDQGEHLP